MALKLILIIKKFYFNFIFSWTIENFINFNHNPNHEINIIDSITNF